MVSNRSASIGDDRSTDESDHNDWHASVVCRVESRIACMHWCIDAAAVPHCINIEPTTNGPFVQVANSQNIETTKRATVSLAKESSSKAKVGHIFDGLKSGSLLSISQLCNNDCVALFAKCDVKIHKHGQIIIVGEHDPANGLWTIPIAPKPTIHRANGAIHDSATKEDLAMFLHAAMCSSVPPSYKTSNAPISNPGPASLLPLSPNT
jgi:hypothetical protein